MLLWWGHTAHGEVADAVVERVQQRVWEGMGLIVLHSGHFSKIFKRLMGTPCSLKWREAGERERLWVINRNHPIAAGLGECIEVPSTEMYGEPFTVPEPMETVFISWYEGGEVFRSGMTWQRGAGRIFYFSPGHETYPIYHQPEIRQMLRNAVRWAHNPAPAWKGIAEAPNVPVDKAPEKIDRAGPRLHKPRRGRPADEAGPHAAARHRRHGGAPRCEFFGDRRAVSVVAGVDISEARLDGVLRRSTASRAPSPTSTRRSPGASSTRSPTSRPTRCIIRRR